MKREEVIETVMDYWYTIDFLDQDAFPRWSEDDKKKSDCIKRKIRNKSINASGDVKEGKKDKSLNMFLEIQSNSESIYEAVRDCAKKHGMTRWGNITFYIGKIKRELCVKNIAAALQEQDKRIEKNIEKIAWFNLQTGADFLYVEDSISLSPVIWAMHQLVENKENEKLSKIFDKVLYDSAITEYNNSLKSISKEGLVKKEKEHMQRKDKYELDAEKKYIRENAYPLKKENLIKIMIEIYQKYIRNSVKLSESVTFGRDKDMDDSIWISFKLYKDEETWNEDGEEDYLGLSKNYFSTDLAMVRGEAKNLLSSNNGMHKKLADYICSKYDESYRKVDIDRINLLEQPSEMKDIDDYKNLLLGILDPSCAPIGKWPSRHMPALMQQIAINLSIQENNTIFSVNGPPGTGKTTLLKEIIVHNVVERAKLLAGYDNPDEAFTHHTFKHGKMGAGKAYTIYAGGFHSWLKDEINDYSVVVASCNNAAVENITKELPVENKIINDFKENELDSEQMKRELETVKKKFTVSENPINQAIQESQEIYWRKIMNNVEPCPEYKDIYFTKYASNLFEKGAWGLIAAPMGSKKNIDIFYKKVLNDLKFALCPNSPKDKTHGEEDKRLKRVQEYQKVQKEFQVQLAIVMDMQRKLKYFSELEKKSEKNQLQKKKINILRQRNELKERTEVYMKKEDELQEAFNEADREYVINYDHYIELEKVSSDNIEKYSEYNLKYREEENLRSGLHISFWDKIFNTKRAKEAEEKYEFCCNNMSFYQQKMEKIKQEIEEAEKETEVKKELYKQAKQVKTQIEQKFKMYQEKNEKIRKQMKDKDGLISDCDVKIEKLERDYEECLNSTETMKDTNKIQWLNDEFIQKLISRKGIENTEAQVDNPWFYERYNREREKLFHCALQLQEAFILASNSFRENMVNLLLYWKMKKGDDGNWIEFDSEDIKESIGKMYQTLFLLVPVISVTFASVGNFFRNLGENTIGTLIVDEAGQALPHMAVGALYRSRKAIIVGDPKQIEPVVKDDLEVLKRAYQQNDICRLYMPKNLSVQTFADSLNSYGTWMDEGFGISNWVGCPLVVHRRCIEPMFGISNRMSYNNIMKQKTMVPNDKNQEMFIYPKSGWIVDNGRELGSKNHFVPEQADKVIKMMEIAFSKSIHTDIYIITPFKTVAYKMKKKLEDYLRIHPQSKMYGVVDIDWIKTHIGTVHTFQGKEADEVIFLLGCDGSKQAEGAVKWVSKNIVNVAVTRAKYRLYVIGDDKAWERSEPVNMVLHSLEKIEI